MITFADRVIAIMVYFGVNLFPFSVFLFSFPSIHICWRPINTVIHAIFFQLFIENLFYA